MTTSFLFKVLDTVECDSCDDDGALEYELQVRVDAEEGEAVGEACEYDDTYDGTSDLSDTAVE